MRHCSNKDWNKSLTLSDKLFDEVVNLSIPWNDVFEPKPSWGYVSAALTTIAMNNYTHFSLISFFGGNYLWFLFLDF